ISAIPAGRLVVGAGPAPGRLFRFPVILRQRTTTQSTCCTPSLLAVLSHPCLRPRRTVPIGGDNGGGIFTQDESDLAQRADAAQRARTSDRHVAQSPCR